MAKKKSSSNDPKRIKQAERTRKNKIKKYENLILEKPNDKDAKVWEEKLNKLR